MHNVIAPSNFKDVADHKPVSFHRSSCGRDWVILGGVWNRVWSASVKARVRSIRGSVLAAIVVAGTACGEATDSSTTPVSVVSTPTAVSPPTTAAPPPTTTSAEVTNVASTLQSVAATEGEWLVRDLSAVAPDGGVALVEHGGELWLAGQIGDDSQLVVSILDAGSSRDVRLDFGQPVITLAMASTPVGVVVVASGLEDFVPHVWVSVDGEQWSSSTISDSAVDVAGVVWLDGRFVAAGSERVGTDPSVGPFEPVLFESSDGIDWSEITVDDPLFAGEGALGPPVIVGDRVVVPGRFTGVVSRNSIVRVVRRWRLVAGGRRRGPCAVVAHGGRRCTRRIRRPLSATGVDQSVVINRTGRWEPVGLEQLTGPSEFGFAFPVGSDPPVFVVEFERPVEYCYEDPDNCRNISPLVVLIDDHGTPSAIDVRAPDVDPGTATIGDDGTFHILLSTGQGLELRSWPTSQGPPPTLPPATVTEPSGPPLVEWDATLEVGKTYRFPLYTHCGIDVLGSCFNGLNWWLLDTPSGEFDGGGGLVFGEIHVIAERQDRLRRRWPHSRHL